MKRFLILHGIDGSPDSNWFMWLKGVLIGKGYEVWLPQLPDSHKPNTEKYNKFLLSNKKFKFDEDTVIIGHSAGAVEILSLLQELPKNTKVAGAILVSAFIDNLNWDALDELFINPLDFEKIKSHCSKFVFVHSDNDPYCPLQQAEFLTEKTDGELIIFEGQGHFNLELGPQYKKFPEIIEIINKL
ncbi:MAG: alpha/beta hydrolase [Candidatus Saccharibacteria bacterium]|nr:alpha/beta hydrolase [Candidatus Saccharibacteria bacterium]